MNWVRPLRAIEVVSRPFKRLGLRRLSRFSREVLRRALPDRLVVSRDGIRIAGAIEDRSYLHSIETGTAEPFMTKLFSERVGPGVRVADVGAYLGYYAIVAAHRRAHVTAFEPDRRTKELLDENVRMNDLADRITVVPYAVSDRAGTVSFFQSEHPVFSSLIAEATKTAHRESTISCVTLDEYFNERAPHVVKLDVQGAEVAALKGMARLLAPGGELATIFVECWPHALELAGNSARELVDLLRSAGFVIKVIDETTGSLTEVDLDNIGTGDYDYLNLLCERPPN